MITEILTERQETLRTEERALLAELGDALRRLDDPAAESVAAGARELDGLFLLSVTGAPEAAVDTLAGALVADPPAADLTVAVHGAEGPGAAARRADLALFLTSAHRPLAPEEHAPLQAASAGARHLLVVVDEAEMLRLSEDLGRMEEAVEVTAERILGRRPLVQMVSTALAADRPPARDSLVPSLAGRIVGVLRSPEVLRPKLLRPLEAALELARVRLAAVEGALAALAGDVANLEVLEGELEGFREAAERALREAEEEAAQAVTGFGQRAGHLVRRGSRPFPLARRLHQRLEHEAVAELPARLRELAVGVEARIQAAAGAARQAVEERVSAFPTERTRAAAGYGPARRDETGGLPAPGAGPVVAELDRTWHGRPDREGAHPLASDLRRTSLLALLLLAAGLAFAAVPALSAATGGAGVLAVALGGGLGGASILAALATLKLGRRRITEDLSGRVEDLRAATAAALAAGAERAVEDGRAAIREPVARYADAVAEERERLTAGRADLERLAARLEGLRARIATA